MTRGATMCDVTGCACATLDWEPIAPNTVTVEAGICRWCRHDYTEHYRYDAPIVAKLVKDSARRGQTLTCLVCNEVLVSSVSELPPVLNTDVLFPHLLRTHPTVLGVNTFRPREIVDANDGTVALIVLKP